MLMHIALWFAQSWPTEDAQYTAIVQTYDHFGLLNHCPRRHGPDVTMVMTRTVFVCAAETGMFTGKCGTLVRARSACDDNATRARQVAMRTMTMRSLCVCGRDEHVYTRVCLLCPPPTHRFVGARLPVDLAPERSVRKV